MLLASQPGLKATEIPASTRYVQSLPRLSYMESFALAAEHSGAIHHVHTISVNPSAISAIKEVRIAVTVIMVGWVAVTGIRILGSQRRQTPS